MIVSVLWVWLPIPKVPHYLHHHQRHRNEHRRSTRTDTSPSTLYTLFNRDTLLCVLHCRSRLAIMAPSSTLINKLKVQLKLSISRLRMVQQKDTAIAKQQRRAMAQLLEVYTIHPDQPCVQPTSNTKRLTPSNSKEKTNQPRSESKT